MRYNTRMLLGQQFFTFLALFLMFSPFSWGRGECQDGKVRQLEMPINHSSSRETFTYKFYDQIINRHATTVIFIPGGPGTPSISDVEKKRKLLNDNFVLTDARGAGCNNSPSLSAEDYSTEKIARDIVALLKHLKEEGSILEGESSQYILYGHSHGTTVATVVADLLKKEKFPAPLALILESPVARAFSPSERIQKLEQTWNLRKAELQSLIQTANTNSFNYSAQEWGAVFMKFLYLGSNSQYSLRSYSQSESEYLNSHTEDFQKYKSVMDVYLDIPSDFQRLYPAIMCKELEDSFPDVQFQNGELTFTPRYQGLCRGEVRTVGETFDSRNYKVSKKTDVYYFLGEHDPVIPASHVTELQKTQSKARSQNIVTVSQAGHGPLSYALSDCAADIFSAIKNRQPLSNGLSNCALGTNLQQFD